MVTLPAYLVLIVPTHEWIARLGLPGWLITHKTVAHSGTNGAHLRTCRFVNKQNVQITAEKYIVRKPLFLVVVK